MFLFWARRLDWPQIMGALKRLAGSYKESHCFFNSDSAHPLRQRNLRQKTVASYQIKDTYSNLEAFQNVDKIVRWAAHGPETHPSSEESSCSLSSFTKSSLVESVRKNKQFGRKPT
jgi:hypothetical protein